MIRTKHILRFTLLLFGLGHAACTDERAIRLAEELTGGSVSRGQSSFRKRGCGSCHEISGQGSAQGHVGPALDGFAKQAYLPGGLPNEPNSLARWLQHPRQVQPTTAMPDLGVSEREARDLSAYLYTLDR